MLVRKKFLMLFALVNAVVAPWASSVCADNVSTKKLTVAERYNQILSTEEKELKKEIYQSIPARSLFKKAKGLLFFSLTVFQAYMLSNKYLSTTEYTAINRGLVVAEPLSNRTKEIAKKCLRLTKMEHVKIIAGHITCALGIDLIVISEEELKTINCSDIEVEATIMHEIMHLKNHDSFNYSCIWGLSKENTPELYLKFTRFTEKRADLQAGLIHIKYAKALASTFERYKEQFAQCSNYEDHFHPPIATRIAYLNELAQALEEESAQKIQDEVAK